jgi:hypothetical protein
MPNKYWIGGTGTNWSTAANWSLTSGVVNPTTVPGVGDDAYFDAASGIGTVTITAGAIATNIYFTNATTGNFGGTLDMATTLTVQNSLTLSPAAGFSVTGTGTLLKSANGGTLTSNGKTWSGSLSMPNVGSTSTTFGDNWTITGNFSASPLNATTITAAAMRTISIGGNLSSGGGCGCTNITFVMAGNGVLSGTYTGNAIAGFIIQINASGTITQNALTISTGTFTYTTAANYTSTSTLSIGGLGATFNNVSGITFNSIGFLAAGGQALTLNSNMNVSGGLAAVGGSAGNVNGAFTLFVSGNITPSSGIIGTATIEMLGSSNSTISAGTIGNNLTLNKTSPATVTITGGLTWGGVAGRTFNINTGNSLILSANLVVAGGIVTFLGTSTLTPNLNTLSLTTSVAKILNTSTVNWYNVNNNTLTTLVVLSSSLNISNNLNFANTLGSAGCGFSGSFNTFVSGSLIATDTGTTSITYPGGGSINMVGAGTIEGTNVMAFTLNINTPNPSGYVFGSVARPTYFLGNPGVINLVSSSIATVFSSSHNLNLRAGSTVNTNNTPTGANLPGGTQILWGNITSTIAGTQTTTISQPIIAQGNLTVTTAAVVFVVNGAKVTVGGNLNCINLQGTSEIELGRNTNGTWSAGTYQNNITVNKSSPGSLTLSGAITWGLANRVLTRTAGSINPSTSTISIPANTNVTINDMTLWNLTIPGASTTTHNVSNTIQNNLTLAATGNTLFTGSAGWTCANLLCSTANRTITLANSSSGTSYRTTTNANLLGTAAQPITMTSNNATTRSLWTLDNGATQSLTYVNGTRIDSSQGATVWSFGGVLTNTVNWGSGSAPATTAYTYIC